MILIQNTFDRVFNCVIHLKLLTIDCQSGIQIKSPPNKIPREKIPLNAVEHGPVTTRVLNPNASEASYKPKQRSYRKTKHKKKPGARLSMRPNVQRPNGGAQTRDR